MARTGLFIARESRVEALAELLVRSLEADMPADPVDPVEIVVGSRGMSRWLTARIATLSSAGIAANLAFPFPNEAIAARVAEILGEPEAIAAADAWEPDRLVWSVLEALAAHADDPDFAPLYRWLAAGGSPIPFGPRAVGLARELAEVLDRVTRYRADLLRAGTLSGSPGVQPFLPKLLSHLEHRLGATHFAVQLARLSGAAPGPMPAPTLRLFGFSTLPPFTLEALAHLARHGRVELYAFVPSTEYIADDLSRERFRGLSRRLVQLGRDEAAAELRTVFSGQNPLLTSLGRLSRDFQAVVEAACEGYESLDADLPPSAPIAAAPAAAPSVLGALQAHLRAAAPPSALAAVLAETGLDDSVQLHRAWGALRQVEGLRDVLLHLFDPTRAGPAGPLAPRDVLVMTPDLATFAPLVAAVFGAGRDAPRDHDGWGASGGPRIPVAIADLGLRALNPVADALLRVLALADHRLVVSGLLDLLALEPVRLRFELEASDLELAARAFLESAMRWGRDAADREAHGLPGDDDAHTLLFGLRRLARGLVQAADPDVWEDVWEGGIAPVDVFEGGDAAVVGRVLHFVRTLMAQAAALSAPRAPAAWREALLEALGDLTTTKPEAAFLLTRVRAELDLLLETDGFDGDLTLGGLRRWLEGRFEAPVSGERTSRGAVTLTSLAPMRSVPYRAIVLLGMDEGVFPRDVTSPGFDPTAAAPRVGDRSARDEDLHLFLEAVLSARERLIITWTGHDERTGEARAPALPVSILLDTLTAACPGREARLVLDHPLQPFSPAAFTPERPSHDRTARAVAAALARPLAARARGLLFEGGEVLPPPDVAPGHEELQLSELTQWIRRPVRELLRRRLGVAFGAGEVALVDRELVELDALEVWKLRDELLATATRGPEADPRRIEARLRAEGRLPTGGAGARAFRAAFADVLPVLEGSEVARMRAAALASDGRDRVALRLPLGSVTLVGEVRGVCARQDDGGGVLLRLSHDDPTKKARHILAGWLDLLAVAASEGGEWSLEIHGRRAGPRGPSHAVLTLSAPEEPRAVLLDLLAFRAEAMCRPLRFDEELSMAEAKQKFSDVEDAWKKRQERGDPWLEAVFGEEGPHRESTLDDVPHPEFQALAARVFEPLRPFLESSRGRGGRG